MTVIPPEDGHAGELVSAHLDGELEPDAAIWVEAHLEVCEQCRASAAAAVEARNLMRSAPPVDAAPVVHGIIARRRRLVGTGLAFVGAAGIVLAALASTAAVTHPLVVPPLDAMVTAHETSSHDTMDGVHAVHDAAGPYAVPAGLEGSSGTLQRRSVFDGRDLVTAVYVADAGEVSVYQQPGRLAWDELPAGVTTTVLDRVVWLDASTGPVVMVTEVGDLVVTVVAGEEEEARSVIAAMPARKRSSTVDRLHDSCQRLIRVFALGA